MTTRQKELLAFIRQYTAEHDGVCPSYDEMCEALGLASKSGISRMIRALERSGHIIRTPAAARSIMVVEEQGRAVRHLMKYIRSLERENRHLIKSLKRVDRFRQKHPHLKIPTWENA